MAVQIYRKEFDSFRNHCYYDYETDEKVCEKALADVNEFLLKHDDIDILKIVENWYKERDVLKLVIYYKRYI